MNPTPFPQIKLLRVAGDQERAVQDFLARALEPPGEEAVGAAVRSLVGIGALEGGGGGSRLTPLGVHLATLPVDVRVGKMLIYAAMWVVGVGSGGGGWEGVGGWGCC